MLKKKHLLFQAHIHILLLSQMAHLIPINCWRSWMEFSKVSYGELCLITPNHLPFKESRIMQGAQKHPLILAMGFYWNSSIYFELSSPWSRCVVLLSLKKAMNAGHNRPSFPQASAKSGTQYFFVIFAARWFVPSSCLQGKMDLYGWQNAFQWQKLNVASDWEGLEFNFR